MKPSLRTMNVAMGLLFFLSMTYNAAAADPLFDLAVSHPTGGALATDLSLVDIDGDWDKDLAIATLSGVSVLKNDGTGYFGLPQIYQHDLIRPRALFSADLDGDGDNDLAVVNDPPNTVSVLLNDGTGGLVYDASYNAGDRPVDIFCTDLDGNGSNDLAVASCGGGLGTPDSVWILTNDGTGTFSEDASYATGMGSNSLYSIDLSGDGHNDLAVANSHWYSDSVYTVSVLISNGDGSFAPATQYQVGTEPLSVVSADVDGDGDNDLIVSAQSPDNVTILLNDGLGGFSNTESYSIGFVRGISVSVADYDGDGDNDLAVGNWRDYLYGDPNISFGFNDGSGTFLLGDSLSLPGNQFYPVVISGDLDGDCDHDVAFVNQRDDSVSVMLNTTGPYGCCMCPIRGNINYDPADAIDISDLVYLVSYMFSGGSEPACMEEANLNGDGSAVPDISDLVYLVSYMFSGGPPPVPCQ